uniref:Uridine 5'-monophosphate synthase n=2 Tax=Clastoptera arizonana TaxID=38151 RepID=A0A1B6E8N6_9HEMI
MESKIQNLCEQLYDIGALKFGDFKMKVGAKSPVYFDLRIIISFPKVMDSLADILCELMKEKGIKCDHICGVPYAALPIATVISVKTGIPMIIRRKEEKDYGTSKMIEGLFDIGDKCIIIEDVVVTGLSILETVQDLKIEQLNVTDTIVLVDREQGATENLKERGVTMHSLLTLSQILENLQKVRKIDNSIIDNTKTYIRNNQLNTTGENKQTVSVHRSEMLFSERAKLTTCPITQQLFKIMEEKQTILCVAADLTSSTHLLTLAQIVGPHICILKTHCDLVSDFTPDIGSKLKDIAREFNFLIMEDRKFSDIGHTVSLQYALVHSWADLVTVHALPGEAVLAGIESKIKEMNDGRPRGVFLVAEMSCEGNLITPQYTKAAIRQTTSFPELVVGVVCQSPDVVASPALIQFTPGVRGVEGNDSLGQKYNTPEAVVKVKRADIAVVGRGIIKAGSPGEAAKTFQRDLWKAYMERIKKS